MADAQQSFLSRMIRRVQPVVDGTYTPAPQLVTPGVWFVERRLKMPPGLLMPGRMTILKLPDAGLLLHSPVQLDDPLASEIQRLGEVRVIVAPNSFHHLYARPYLERFEGARFLVAPGLRERIENLPDGADLSDGIVADTGGTVECRIYGPIGGVAEAVLYHRPTRTMLLTDLAFHLQEFPDSYSRIMWRLAGVPKDFGPSRTARMFLLRDREAAKPYLARMLDWDFDRILVTHGVAVETNGRAEFLRAFRDYLPSH